MLGRDWFSLELEVFPYTTMALSIQNTYKPPQAEGILEPPPQDEPYDINFCFPLDVELESERVRLVPLMVSRISSADRVL